MNNATLEKAHQLISSHQKILVTSHIRPDGDAVGSVLGLGLALQANGKEVQMVLEDGVPKSFRHLTGSDLIIKKPTDVDVCTIVVDCSDRNRIGRVIPEDLQPDLNIDHHNTNLNFAGINLVDSKATATTEILASLLPAWDLQITPEVAEALLTGLITDTLGFRVAGMTPATLRTAAGLFELGADLPVLYTKALLTRSFKAARYWGTGLSALQLEKRLLWTRLTLEDRQTVDYPGRDDADLINILQTVEDADVFVIFVEQNNGSVKVSWRSRPGFDVSKIALQFGGGGHKPAAGAEIQGNIEEVIPQVLTATRPLLNGQNSKE
jgi:bifunctional oligoribonuclease and PAP phosphatase NrnA